MTEDRIPRDEHPEQGICCCYSGWVFISYEEDGETKEAVYECRRCTEAERGD